jgi:hypothetical protein
MTTPPLSAELREAVVSACGQAFHYKDTLRPVFVNAGVPGLRFDGLREQELSKYVICREILRELDGYGERGRNVQQAIVVQLAALHTPMPDADPALGKQALDRVRALAKLARILVDEDSGDLSARRKRRGLADAARKAKGSIPLTQGSISLRLILSVLLLAL